MKSVALALLLAALGTFPLRAQAAFVQDASFAETSGAVTTISAPAITVTGTDTLVALVFGPGPQPSGTYLTCSGFTYAGSVGVGTSLTFSPAPTGTSGTLAANWGGLTGSYAVKFSDGEQRYATLTNGNNAVNWSGSLTGSPTTSAAVGDNSSGINVYYELNAASGSTTVSCTAGSASLQAIYVAEYSGIATSGALLGVSGGLVGGPGTTADAVTTATLSVASTPAEVIGYSYDQSGYNASSPVLTAGTGFTLRTAFGSSAIGTYIYPEDEVPGSGTSFSATWTSNSSGQYDSYGQVILAFKAASGGACTHGGWSSSGTIATPNGTSGSYWGKTGAWVTPDCSTVEYWQPSVGNWGVN